MDKENLERNIIVFNLFMNKLTIIQFWTGMILGSFCVLVMNLFELIGYSTLLWGLVIVAVLLVAEGIYYMLRPFHFTNKYGTCLTDLKLFRAEMTDKLKVFGLILIMGILFSIICIFVPSFKLNIPVSIPVVIFGALQMVKTQLVLFKCWVLEDEIIRSE